MQPFRGQQMVVIEKRGPDGALDFTGEQPPVGGMKFDEVYKMFFRAHPEHADGRGTTATWEELSAWLKGKGWTIRAKTW